MSPPVITRFQRLWSYLKEVPLETTQSSFNPYLHVCLRRGRVQLCTENAIYSYGDLYDNFTRTFERLRLDALTGDNVLLLGLGLGSIPYMLEKKFNRSYYYTAVEVDPEIIRLANDYVLHDLKSGIDVICADAFEYVEYCADTFDLICMDVFQDAVVPEEATSDDFFEALKALLNPGGLLLFNKLSYHEDERAETIRYYRDCFLKHFPDGTYLDTGTNYVLMNHAKLL